MGKDKKTVLYNVGPNDIPKSKNLEEDRSTLNNILNIIFDNVSPISFEVLSKCGPCTEWVIWQLGCVAEHLSLNSRHQDSINTANVSVLAASETYNIKRLLANTLTLGNVLLKANCVEEAKSTYLKMLEIQVIGFTNEKAGAHITLGQIYQNLGNTSEAIYHFEKGIFLLSDKPPANVWENMLHKLGELYAITKDPAGATFCLHNLGREGVEEISNVIIDSNSFELVFSFINRLNLLGEHQLAINAFEMWKTMSQSNNERSQ